MTAELADEARRHLYSVDGQEDLCFALWNPSSGASRQTALIHELLLPQEGERIVHGNVSFTGDYVARALHRAAAQGSGIALLHSHLGPGWQDMSDDDIAAEERIAPSAFGGTGLPLVGLTRGTDGVWSGRWWLRTGNRRYSRTWCQTTRVAGSRRLSISHYKSRIPAPPFSRRNLRTRSAWGDAIQADLQRMTIGVVGLGSVGSIVSEALARIGVAKLLLIDFDGVEEVNLDRTLNATADHVRRGLSKVAVAAESLAAHATAQGFKATPSEYSVVEKRGYIEALDCDLLFSCVDRPWPRFALNTIALGHLIPVIDGGILARRRSSGYGLARADIRAYVATADGICIECIGQYDPADVALERDGHLDNPEYIASLPAEHHLKARQNVFGFSLMCASLEILQFISQICVPDETAIPGQQTYHVIPGKLARSTGRCRPTCYLSKFVAYGDRLPVSAVGNHGLAQAARQDRRNKLPLWRRMLDLGRLNPA